ncbi:hypothetical protein AN189_02200 [Loktanella sp. 3ANDIMAR09]|nr:hypothetical protein AN189_02200 [Loktanella sp. 3ANDIMAR09]
MGFAWVQNGDACGNGTADTLAVTGDGIRHAAAQLFGQLFQLGVIEGDLFDKEEFIAADPGRETMCLGGVLQKRCGLSQQSIASVIAVNRVHLFETSDVEVDDAQACLQIKTGSPVADVIQQFAPVAQARQFIRQHHAFQPGLLVFQFRDVDPQTHTPAAGRSAFLDPQPAAGRQLLFHHAVFPTVRAEPLFKPLILLADGVKVFPGIQSGLQDFAKRRAFGHAMRALGVEGAIIVVADDQPVFVVIIDKTVGQGIDGRRQLRFGLLHAVTVMRLRRFIGDDRDQCRFACVDAHNPDKVFPLFICFQANLPGASGTGSQPVQQCNGPVRSDRGDQVGHAPFTQLT